MSVANGKYFLALPPSFESLSELGSINSLRTIEIPKEAYEAFQKEKQEKKLMQWQIDRSREIILKNQASIKRLKTRVRNLKSK